MPVQATPDPGCKFKQWRITPQGADVSESYVLDEPNPVLEFQRPVTARATFVHTYGLQVSTRGNGSVSIEPEKEMYEAGETVVLSAQGDPGWAFDHWTGDIMGMMAYDASAQVWMIENRSITAVFIERPGLTEVDFIGDLEYFLLDIGVEEDISTFDWNEIEYDADAERVYVGNGIPDVAELCLVEGVLDRRSLDHSFRSGVYHDFIWDIWNVNLAQAAVDLPGEDPRIQRVVAGYMTLGDFKSEGFIDKLVTIHYNSEGLNTAAYESNGQRYLYYKSDADNDGVLNYEEWEWASPNNSIANIPAFVEAALDGVEPDEGEQSAFADRPVDLFAPEMDEVFAALDHSAVTHFDAKDAGGAMDMQTAAALMATMGISEDGLCPYCKLCAEKFGFKAYSLYLDKPGHMVTFEVNGKSYVGSAEKKLQVPGGMPVKKLKALFPDHFGLVEWSAPGSLIDGSREEEIDSVSLFSETTANPLVRTKTATVPISNEYFAVSIEAPPGSKTGTSEKNSLHQYVMTRIDEFVVFRVVSKLKNYVAYGWTGKGLWHVLSPVAVLGTGGDYYPCISPVDKFEKFVLNNVLLEQTQGGLALASNSYGYGGHYAYCLRLGINNPISFTARVSPEREFVRWEYYAPGESQPFLTADTTRVDLHWTQAANAVARVVTRPKDEYKLHLETKVAHPGTPGDDCPGYVVVEDARTIGTISYHGPKRYYPKDGWVRIRAVANPGYRFVKWETSENVTGAVLFFGIPFIEIGINAVTEERIAVRMDDDTTLRAVFEWDPIKLVQLAQGELPEREIRKKDDKETKALCENVATIGIAPSMPVLKASLRGAKAGMDIQWRLEVAFKMDNNPQYITRCYPGINEAYIEKSGTGPFADVPWTENGQWNIDFGSQLWGGDAILYCSLCSITAKLPFKIWGTNPSYENISTYLAEDKYRALCMQESRYKQFMEDFIPEGAGEREGGSIGMPKPNSKHDGGYGLFQITFQKTISDCWNWKSNAYAGKARLDQDILSARSFCEGVLSEIPPARRYLPEEYILKEAWTRYNGGPKARYWDPYKRTTIEIDGETKDTLVKRTPVSDSQKHADAVWGYYVSKPWEE